MGKVVDLSSIELHDADIVEINLKSECDSLDRIEIILESISFEDNFKADKIMLIINKCYKAKLNINSWISGRDVIVDFFITEKSDWLDSLIEINSSFGPKNKKLKHLCLNTNTSSKIEFILTEDIVIKPIKID